MVRKKLRQKQAKNAPTGRFPRTVQLGKGKGKSPFRSSVARPKRPKRRPGVLEEDMYLEQDEIAALFRVITSKRDTAIFRVAYHRGLRAHEVGLLTLADFRGDRLFVHRGKGSESRAYRLTRIEAHALRIWIRDRGNSPGPLFPSRNRQAITRSRLDQLMKTYCDLAGIPPEKAHMHALKHSCGTHLAERGDQADTIQDWLGHRDLKSTAIYTHFSKRRRDEAALRHLDWR